MVFFRGQKPPKSLKWKAVEGILVKLGAEYQSTEGDHRKYTRRTSKGTEVIILPIYSDISGGLLDSIIHQTGVRKKEFWGAYFETKPKTNKLVVEPGENS